MINLKKCLFVLVFEFFQGFL